MKISDTVVGAGFVTAGALIIAGTLNYPTLDAGHPGPSLFPRILGGLMAVFGGLVSVQGLRNRDTTEDVEWLLLYKNTAFINAMFVLVGVLAYILFVEKLGFLVMGAAALCDHVAPQRLPGEGLHRRRRVQHHRAFPLLQDHARAAAHGYSLVVGQ